MDDHRFTLTARRFTAARSRRQVLGAAAKGAAGGLGAYLAGAGGARAQETPTATPTATCEPVIYVRRGIGGLPPTGLEVASLRAGVAAMRARPATDPTSWIYQANMHGTTDTPALPEWSTCEHFNYFFLSWHRMYLYWFERILRAASGDPLLALPYWNYSDPAQRALPIAFRQPADASNPLFVTERNPVNGPGTGINDGAQLPAAAVLFADAFAFTNFSAADLSLSFSGEIEATPHGGVHVLVGGDTGLMRFFETAGRDPIFWLHHANLDRLWQRWLDPAVGGANPPASDLVWMDTPYTFFDENGQPVVMTGKEIIDTVGQLGYRYDDDPAPDPADGDGPPAVATPTPIADEPATEVAASAPDRPIELGADPVVVPVELGDEAPAIFDAPPTP
ncbi:MAG: tyrosinase family protein, partial [Chloroflexia bacterium]|nr:tyrosinase family protein [Chloroflexia bacterium]